MFGFMCKNFCDNLLAFHGNCFGRESKALFIFLYSFTKKKKKERKKNK